MPCLLQSQRHPSLACFWRAVPIPLPLPRPAHTPECPPCPSPAGGLLHRARSRPSAGRLPRPSVSLSGCLGAPPPEAGGTPPWVWAHSTHCPLDGSVYGGPACDPGPPGLFPFPFSNVSPQTEAGGSRRQGHGEPHYLQATGHLPASHEGAHLSPPHVHLGTSPRARPAPDGPRETPP